MAKLSGNGKYVTVERGDTLWAIAEDFTGLPLNYKKLAAANNVQNPDRIYVGQTIYLDEADAPEPEPAPPTKAVVNQFGLQSDADNTLFAAWTWDRENTASYKVSWTYDTGDGVWFVGSNSTISVDKDDPDTSRQSTYSIPKNAKLVRFKVKPISETHKKNNTETNYWDAEWSNVKTYDVSDSPPSTPAVPTVTIEKYTLTAVLDNIEGEPEGIQFQIVKDNAASAFKTAKVKVVSAHASYACSIDAGGEYKVRCRSYKGERYSGWSNYSNNASTIPSASSGITVLRASSETSVYLEWEAVGTATSYDIEYSTKKEYFDGSDKTTTVSNIEFAHYEKTGLESGTEYFFRVRSVNKQGNSAWTDIKSVIIGKDPAAPTTWSSTTTAITGEVVTLYWVHNAEDGSSQTYAELELYVDGVKETHTITNSTEEDEKDKTSFYQINTSSFVEGTKIQWRVRTAGITKAYGDWSVQRTIDIYAPATLELRLTDLNGDPVEVVTSFPLYVNGLPGPKTQLPIGYHVSIVANEMYESVDNIGNLKTVNKGEEVYSRYFDTTSALLVELSAGNIDLENNISYTVTCTVSMDSGLTTESSLEFTVSWTDDYYHPDAEIGLDADTLTAYIQPYCEARQTVIKLVELVNDGYVVTDDTVKSVWGVVIAGARTTTGERVYSGVNGAGEDIYYTKVEEVTGIDDVLLSVYRREFDGSFTELASGLDSSRRTTITDPHPALDYARYRIVATSKTTGAVSYYDLPGYPVNCSAVIIQWDEEWTSFETSEETAMEQPPWSGSLLRLPYNIDVSDNNDLDVAHIEYIGREHPISYYGTQLGESSTWNVVVEKSDKETVYALRRLAKWMGDVYVREPSGSGYWASISVSFSQKHCDLTVPVTLNITRVEGGV